MAKDVSIAFKASDNLTNSIQSMRKSVNGLSRDVSEYRKIQSQAFDKKTEIKFDISKAKQELKELEKAVKQNVEGSEKAFKEKQRTLEDLQEEYKRLTKVANDASKAESRLQDDMNKSNNLRNTMAAQQNSMLKSLAGAGLGNMLGDALSHSISQDIASMFGTEAGNAINSVLGGIASGAALGSVAGPVGTAVGAAVGGIAGTITAESEKQQRDDDRFINEVQSLYSKVTEQQEQSLSSGIDLASKRETDMISYETLLGGPENASKFLNDIQDFGSKTPFEEDDLLEISKVLLSYKYKQDEIIPFMTKIGDTASALGIDKEGQNVVATALGRMKSSGKTSLEYIYQLSERAIPAIDYLAEALGKTNAQIYEMISKGAIDGAKASQIIVDAMGKEFEGNMKRQSQTYSGLVSTLNDTWSQLDRAMGEGYTTKRKEGLESEIEQLSGKLGDKMREANRLIGEFEASLENKYQQSIIDAMSSAMETDEYKMAKREDDEIAMARLVWEARTQAEIDYKNSEEMKLKYEAERGLVQDIQQALIDDNVYLDYGKSMGEQFSLGYSGVIREALAMAPSKAEGLSEEIQKHGSFTQKLQDKFTGGGTNTYGRLDLKEFEGYATGLDRVPRNDMLVRVHEGERILTKLDADKQDRGATGIHIDKLADTVVIREEADIEKVAYQFYLNLEKRAMNTSLG
ncbi:tape measure protein [Zhenhengia sp.]|uniref:tape measure protein n=1 Tax=Zhenhengia sp. TaxID=2944208 RepID=UPI0030796360